MNRWLIVSLCGWAVSYLASRQAYVFLLFFCLFALLYFSLRFSSRRYSLFFLVFSCALTLHNLPAGEPPDGLYTVYEVKKEYCLARNGRHLVVIYEPDAAYHDRFEVRSFQKITSLKNLSLFSFQEHMEKKNVSWASASHQKVSGSGSRKARLYRKIREQDDPFLLSSLYRIHKEDTLFSSLGVPQVTLFSMIERSIRRRKGNGWSRPASIAIVLLYALFFPFHPACIRFVLVQFSKWMSPNWQLSMIVQMTAYPLLVPGGADDLVLIVPMLFTWIAQKGWTARQERIARLLFLVLLQIVFFSKIDLVSLFLFSCLKTLYAFLFAGKLLGLSFPFLEQLPAGNFLVFDTHPGLLFKGALCVAIAALLVTPRFRKIAAYSFMSLVVLFASIYCDPFFHVYMLDIGQGDCTLIVEPFKKSAVMIDAGQNLYRDNVEQIIVPFLRSRHIGELTALIATHDDFDHSGGVESLAQHIPIGQVITKRNEPVDVDYPFYSLAPERQAKDENDESIVSYFSYDGTDYLWMGDAGIDVEKQLLEQYDLSGVDVLKLGHHGSGTSSSFGFLMETDPQLALISVGKNNRYKHPHTQVLDSLAELRIDTLMTKEDGMVHLFSWNSIRLFETASGKIGFLKS